MSYDPNSGYGTNPQNPYGQPGQPGQPPQQPPYGQPGQPGQPPFGQHPPQNPYGPPQVDPYSAPQPNFPPQQGQPFPQPGAQPFPGQQYQPLPLGMAFQQLPNQYLKVTTKPSAQSFAEELPKAGWDIIWIQLLVYAAISAVFTLIQTLIPGAGIAALTSGLSGVPGVGGAYASIAAAQGVMAFIQQIIYVPIVFFVGVGIQFLLSKMFGGQGDFKGQAYTSLLFTVPLGILSAVVGIIPFLGGILGFAIGIYNIVLNVFQVQASQRLSGGKATWVVLIPYLVLIGLVIICAICAVTVLASMFNSMQQTYP